MGYGYGPGFAFDVWALIPLALFLLVVVAAVWLVVWAVRRRPAAAPVGPRLEGAERILAERLARGEIDEEEYRRRLAALREQIGG